jgi:hypothetical protein
MKTVLLKNYPIHGFFKLHSKKSKDTFTFINETVQLLETKALFFRHSHQTL